MASKILLAITFFSIFFHLAVQSNEMKFLNINYDFYQENCRDAESIVRNAVKMIVKEHSNAPAQLLRLLFHDCFIKGCDASVMLDDSNPMANRSAERQAIPNKTLKGFNYIDTIKEQLENACPGVVSCADILVLATRDAIALTGGPYYPVLTGRRDSLQSHFSEALAEIPRPDGSISESLHLFALRGFSERETAALLGGHNIGKIGCEFIQPRFLKPDAAIPLDFLLEIRRKCQATNGSMSNGATAASSRHLSESRGMFYQGLSSTTSSGGGFDSHYYQTLIKGKGLLFADQELMSNEKTAEAVLNYADNAMMFRSEFA